MAAFKIKASFSRLAQSIYFQAFVVAVAIILLLPDGFGKYKLELAEKTTTSFREHQVPDAKQYGFDLNGDGS
ncbi:MAG: hypothetical protein U5L09_18045 [Bacteroidales bacterium]|nr:hypothetical protein [Bacteroidales bacterium]